MTRIITTLALASLLLSTACHNKKKPEAPPSEPAPAAPTAPMTPATPEQPAPVRGPSPG